jgi:hypothetical protein
LRSEGLAFKFQQFISAKTKCIRGRHDVDECLLVAETSPSS